MQKARELAPRSVEVLFKLATTYQETGLNEEAIAVYRELLTANAENRAALTALRDLLIKLNEWQEADELQQRLLKTGSASDDEKQLLRQIRCQLAQLALQQGELEEAISICRELTTPTQ